MCHGGGQPYRTFARRHWTSKGPQKDTKVLRQRIEQGSEGLNEVAAAGVRPASASDAQNAVVCFDDNAGEACVDLTGQCDTAGSRNDGQC